MIRGWRKAAAFVAVGLTIGILGVASGIVPITASSGHWPITAWLLHFAMRRSVATHTLWLEAPPLEETWLAVKGAAHYEIACRGCHGSPEEPYPTVAQHMTPRPPYLVDVLEEWEPAELFYVVKHGVKFTGMPAWPAQQREDEVWAMVAFLRQLADLDAAGYRRLVDGEEQKNRASAVRPLAAELCDRCHGVDGQGRGVPAFPRLAGQRPAYLRAALEAFAGGERHSGIMAPVATSLRPEEMGELAMYYGSLQGPSRPRVREHDATAIDRGQAIARRGVPSQRIPSCVDCHGPSDIPRNPAYPVLAGQYSEYLALQLELFKEERRGGSAHARLMRPVAARLTPAQMRDVAVYYESLTP
jgi:cytochrome c553